MQETLSFYKGKKILLTGHTGFKGAWLSRILINAGASVYGIALTPEADSILTKTGDFGFTKNLVLDIRNQIALDSFISQHKFDGVFHLAAQPLVRESYKQPVETFETNVMGTIYLLNSLLKHNSTPWSVVITTDKVYKNIEKRDGYIENESLGGKDPYSASKAAAEIAITAWQNLAKLGNGMRIASARSGNVIGGGDHSADRLLPDLIRGFKSNKKTIIRNPGALRPWQHVLDPLWGYLMLGKAIAAKEVSPAYNFGPTEDSKLNVLKMAQIACENWSNNSGFEIVQNPYDPPESTLLWLDSTLARRELGWQTKLNAEEAIKWTLEWEQEASGSSALTALDAQIQRYIEVLK